MISRLALSAIPLIPLATLFTAPSSVQAATVAPKCPAGYIQVSAQFRRVGTTGKCFHFRECKWPSVFVPPGKPARLEYAVASEDENCGRR